MPSPMNRQIPLCSGVARASRGNHASGVARRRPSDSSTVSSSSLTETPTARGMDLAFEEPMPCLQELLFVLDHEPPESAEVVPPEAPRVGQGYWTQPELRYGAAFLDVHVGRLVPFMAEEVEPRIPDSSDGRHRTS